MIHNSQYRSSRREAFCKTLLLKTSQNSQEKICSGVSFSLKFQASGLKRFTKETQAPGFCELCHIFKKTFFVEHLQIAVADNINAKKIAKKIANS